uniref:Uncharacterized protein n=1 Tax=Cucumis melo TaxID=3656 RepID=A0A9I9E2I2_CUCME
MLNHFLEAIAVMKHALDVDPTNLEMLHALGVSHANEHPRDILFSYLCNQANHKHQIICRKLMVQVQASVNCLELKGVITKQMTAIEEMVASEYN